MEPEAESAPFAEEHPENKEILQDIGYQHEAGGGVPAVPCRIPASRVRRYPIRRKTYKDDDGNKVDPNARNTHERIPAGPACGSQLRKRNGGQRIQRNDNDGPGDVFGMRAEAEEPGYWHTAQPKGKAEEDGADQQAAESSLEEFALVCGLIGEAKEGGRHAIGEYDIGKGDHGVQE